MRIFSYGKERRERSNLNIYVKSTVIGSIAACLLIVLGISLKFIITKSIEHWIISTIIIVTSLIAWKMFYKKRRGVKYEYPN